MAIKSAAARERKVKQVMQEIEKVVDAHMVSRSSRQPRFSEKSKQGIFSSVYRWIKNLELNEPVYSVDSRERDGWLRDVVKREPFLMGVLSTVSSIDKNRGWKLTGAERFVQKYTDVLHNIQVAPDIRGWRPAMSVMSQSYNGADMGAIMELGWQGNSVQEYYTADPTRFRLTGNSEQPIRYYPSRGASYPWDRNAYFRIVDLPSTNEALNGLGFSSVSRCIEMAKIMIAIFDHDREKLLSKAPNGMLLLKGISQSQWEQTLEDNQSQMSEKERKYYAGIQILAGDQQDIDAKLVSLSTMPENMNQTEFVNMVMYLYALAFKYDSREFWPVSGGQLGTASETRIQHQKAGQKGGVDFTLSLQENLQECLPQVVEFEFDERDVASEILQRELDADVINNVTALLMAADPSGETIVNVQQSRELLAEAKIVPSEWADPVNTIGSDTDDQAEEGLDLYPEYVTVDTINGKKTISLADLGRPYQVTVKDLQGQSTTLNGIRPTYDITPDSIYKQRITWDSLMSKRAVQRSVDLMPAEAIATYSSIDNKFTKVRRPVPVYYSIPSVERTLSPAAVQRVQEVIAGAEGADIQKRDPEKQVKKDDISSFLEELTRQGIHYGVEAVKISEITPSQKEIKREKVDSIKWSMQNGSEIPAVVLDKFGIVADGHHRMIAAKELYGDSFYLPAVRVQADVDEIHAIMEKLNA